ncbi:MAG TPA: CYTH and CHAD domain-containing protein [Geminicoccaceae bacterium]|nr:CYTH and CHAD domain-containing protein [Geminicoccaceae bacterium]
MTTEAGDGSPSVAETEVELKLSGQPEALETIFASPTIRGISTGRGVTRRLENVYYDTHDQRLRARGLAFRVRRHGRRYVQTLKSNDTEGLVSYRGEWETPLPSSEPDLAVLPVGALEILQGLVSREELETQFTTRVRRRVRRIRLIDQKGRESLIEAALDSGTIETRGERMPIAEIELELLEGSPDALYSLALELEKLAPLRIETRSKSALGYALASGQAPAWHKAAALALDPRDSVEESFRQILRSCVQHWCANEAAALDGRDPEGVHQLRVAIRRLRSAFSVFSHLVERDERRRLSGEAKRIINSLGPARDWDVFSTELLAPIGAARPGDADLARLLEAAQVERQRAYEPVRAEIGSQPYTRYLLELRLWIEAGGWREHATDEGARWFDQPITAFADKVLGKRHRKARQLGRHFARLSAAERHAVRIALKKLRYACEFFESLYRKRDARPYLGSLKRMQDCLGHVNDVAVAEKLALRLVDQAESQAERESLRMAAGLVLGWYGRGVADAEPALVEAWRAFAHGEPFWHR